MLAQQGQRAARAAPAPALVKQASSGSARSVLVKQASGSSNSGGRLTSLLLRRRDSSKVGPVADACAGAADKAGVAAAAPCASPASSLARAPPSPDACALSLVLADRELLLSFLSFLHLQHAAENIKFLLSAQCFASVFSPDRSARLGVAVDAEAVQRHARDVFERFLNKDAPCWVCVQPIVTAEIEAALRGERASALIFAKAVDETKHTLEKDALPRFLKWALEGEKVSGVAAPVEVRVKLEQHPLFVAYHGL
jgi:hypothetical protein